MPAQERFSDQSDHEYQLNQATRRWARTWVEVDLAALRRNAGRLIARLPAGGRLIISAKKHAYGHGLRELAETLGAMPGIWAIGLATIEEAVALRRSGSTAPLMLFCIPAGDALEAAIAHEITLTITTLDEAQAASEAARRLGRVAEAHFKLDTGMGRLGRLAEEVHVEIEAILHQPALRITGIYTHLASALADPASGRRQWAGLKKFIMDHHLENLPAHVGGSDSYVLDLRQEAGLGLRAGIALYGDHPTMPDLEPVMTFKSRVIYRRAVPAGTPISYGGIFTTSRPTELAIVGAGYGNGYPRVVSGRGADVLLHGRRCPLLGRVCMDQIIVDVTEIPDVSVGDEAVLFGRQQWREAQALLPAAEIAEKAGTISYELFCLAGQINPRCYKSTTD